MKTFKEIQAALLAEFNTKQAIIDLKDDIKRLYPEEEIKKIIRNVMWNEEAPASARNAAEEDVWALPNYPHQIREKHLTMIAKYSPEYAEQTKQVMELMAEAKNLVVTKKVKKVVTKEITEADRENMKTSNKALFEGHCQCCGAQQKLPKGVLSKHGYTVDWGFFNGVCQGAGHKAYEESCALIASFIESAKNSREACLAQIETLETDTETVWMNIYVDRKHLWKQFNRSDINIQTYPGSDLITYYVMFGEGDKPNRNNSIQVGSHSTHNLDQAIKYQNSIRARIYKNQIIQIDEYITWQEERVANWKPQPLIAVKD